MATGFFSDESCFWHGGGNYATTVPVGGFVQPLAYGGLPEMPEAKRRLKNLLEVSGLYAELTTGTAPTATRADLLRVHPNDYIDAFKSASDNGGGELGLRTPFGPGGYEIAAQSAGLAKEAICAVARGDLQNSYALTRPPGHHCTPDFPNGFCLLSNIAIGVEAAIAQGYTKRIVVLDWDVHHGNGTEAVFYERADVLTISIHQEHNYPLDTGDVTDRGAGPGRGGNINIPLPPGAGHDTYLEAMQRIVLPQIAAFRPDMIVVACGYDAAAIDPLGRMLATADTFRQMTQMISEAAATLCRGKLAMVHEGGYSEVYVPFCGHAVIEVLSGTKITVDDPFAQTFALRQPNARLTSFYSQLIDEMQDFFNTPA
ncbi:class II histone deacetylase [Cochlodiniinecator piscidefendens]|uniref:class II histone deacetylase n=1 Tax=Cochlodiniinecator piscidefendens TaxID=2715756 RepID=UPI00140E7F8F|nr:class II histone deacetylase [Cochlodiniinecator piscidefendens]